MLLNVGTGCPESLWKSHPWRYLELDKALGKLFKLALY